MTLRSYFGIGLIALTALAPATFAASAAREPSGPSTPTASSRAPLLVIANKSEDTISLVNLKTLHLEGKVNIGRGPHEVVVTPDGRWAFTANYEGPGDTISWIDVASRQERERIRIDPYRRPHGLAISRDGRSLYATCEANQAVIEVEVATGKIGRVFRTGQRITHMLALTPDSRKLYTSNILSGNVTAIDLTTEEVLAQISTDRGAEGIAVAPSGKEVWVTNREADTISIIEVASDQVVATLPCPGFPIRLQFTPDGEKALVSCYLEGSVAVFEVAARKEIKRIKPTSPPLGRPIGLLIEPLGQRAYVADTVGDRVLVIDMASLEVVDRIPAGREPDGLAYVPAR